uniref:Uncharacterized protein n=1 Tax=Anguilla anguilla TaxID=7936 RepID=A0A0E9RYL1_ANGAN
MSLSLSTENLYYQNGQAGEGKAIFITT